MKIVSSRIGLFIPNLAGGGAEKVMLTLARGLVGAGYDVDIVVAEGSGPLVREIPEGVRLVDLKSSRCIGTVPPSLPGLVRYYRRERPGAILSALTSANCVAVLARTFARVPIWLVLSEHGFPSRIAEEAAGWRMWLLPIVMKWTYPKADRIVAVSHGLADDLAMTVGMARERIDVIYNPVVTPEMLELSNESIEHPWFMAGEPPVILGVGRLIELKDFATLIYAFAEIRKILSARLVILGEGKERRRLESIVNELGVREDVSMPGFLKNPYVYMRHASVVVVSSRSEGFGSVLVEAMACETPVVSTDCRCGPREILEGGKWGCLVPPGEPGPMVNAILATVKKSGRECSSRANLFNVKRALDKYTAILTGNNDSVL